MAEAISARVFRVRDTSSPTSSMMAAVDQVAVESPLEIRLRLGVVERVLSMTMRTPGADEMLALGFLLAEGVLALEDFAGDSTTADHEHGHGHGGAEQTRRPDSGAGGPRPNVDVPALDAVRVTVSSVRAMARAEEALRGAERRFVTSAACGVCGRESIAALVAAVAPTEAASADAEGDTAAAFRMAAAAICELPARLRERQSTFASTGGLHAAGAFTAGGVAIAVHEDVGRHNAVDKLVGTMACNGGLPARGAVLVVSGRASFELVQKAARAGFPMLVAVGAPSSLAIETASAADMTLVGFVRDRGFNIYCGAERIASGPDDERR